MMYTTTGVITPKKGNVPLSLANVKPSRQEIQNGVFLYTYRLAEPTRFYYEVECAKYQRLSITIHFEGSDNMELENEENPLSKTVVVEPFQRVTVGTLSLIDPYMTAQLKVSYKMKVLKPEPRHISSAIQRDKDEINIALHGSTYASLNQRQSLREINMACVEHEVNFVDATFPPVSSSLMGALATTNHNGTVSTISELQLSSDTGDNVGAEALLEIISQTKNVSDDTSRIGKQFLKHLNSVYGGVTWRRPEEFMGKNYDLYRRKNGAIGGGPPSVSPSDIREGKLGDYWLMSALSVIAERPHLVHRLFQSPSENQYSEQLNTHGAYKIWLTKNGERRSVLVDDYLPCSPGGGPLFSRSNDNTLWVSLVEKAMAKLHGGYVYLKSSLRYRFTHEGLTDLTGAPTTNIRFDEYRAGSSKKSSATSNFRGRKGGDVHGGDGDTVVYGAALSALSALWEDIQEYHELGHLICVTTYGENGDANDVSNNNKSMSSKRELVEKKDDLKISRAKIRGDFIPCHSYSILNLHQIQSTGERLVHLRNPWSCLKWNGDWSRSSLKWNSNTRDEIKDYQPNIFQDEEPADGGGVLSGDTFWVLLEDVVELFESMSVCRVGSVSNTSNNVTSRRKMNKTVKDGKENKKSIKKKKIKKKRGGGREGGTASGSLNTLNGALGIVQAAVVDDTSMNTIWSECRVRGTFSTSKVDEVVRTNMYLLDVPSDTSDVIIQLHQRDSSCYGERDYVDVGISLLSLSKDGSAYRMVPGGSTGFQVAREVTLELDQLEEGRYVIVPISSGCKYRHEADELKRGDGRSNDDNNDKLEDDGPKLRLTTKRNEQEAVRQDMSDLDWASTLSNKNKSTAGSPSSLSLSSTAKSSETEQTLQNQQKYQSKSQMTPLALVAFHEIFHRLDEDMDGVLNKEELDSFMIMSEGTLMHEDVYRWVVQTFDVSVGHQTGDIGLTKNGFVGLYLYMFDEAGGGDDESILWRDLQFMGYNSLLQLTRATTFVLSIHSNNNQIRVTKVGYDPEAYEEAMSLPVKTEGECITLDENGEVILRKRNNGYWGVSFAIENRTIKKESGKIRKNNNNDDAGQDMTFTLDCSDSINVVSGPLGLITKTSGSGDIQQQQKLIRTVVVKPGEIKIVHHLVPKTQGPWSWKYKATWDFI